MNHLIRTDVGSDQIGKVFCVVGRDMRQCLICDEVFTPQTAAMHAYTECLPSQKSLERLGGSKDANRQTASNCRG